MAPSLMSLLVITQGMNLTSANENLLFAIVIIWECTALSGELIAIIYVSP